MKVHEDFDQVLMPIWDAKQEEVFPYANEFSDEEWTVTMDDIADEAAKEAVLAVEYPAIPLYILDNFAESTYVIDVTEVDTVKTYENKWLEFDLIIEAFKQRHSKDGVEGEK